MRDVVRSLIAAAVLALAPCLAHATGFVGIDPAYNGVTIVGGSSGSLSAKANAASQSSVEGATTDPLSMDLNRWLRMRNEDCANVALGCIGDAYATTHTGSYTAISALKGIINQLETLVANQGNASTVNQGTGGGTPWSAKIDQTTPGSTNAVTPVAAATGGATSYGLQAAASTNSTNVKNAAGVVYGINLINTNTTIYYLRMYDASAAPTCSSATNFSRTWPIPPASAVGGAGGIAVSLPAAGVQFSNGISFCVTGGPTSTDNTSAATGVFINLDYK